MPIEKEVVSRCGRLKLPVLFIGALLVFSTSCTMWPEPKDPYPATVAARIQKNVVYGSATGVTLKLDFYFPAGKAVTARPVVMYVHGGGWEMGDKSMVALMPGPAELLRRGFVVASINYRLAPDYKFPAMLEDAKCAVRFLRAHAREFNLDPNHIGVMGDSAGGHLVALLGLTDARAGFDGDGGWSNESSRVQAVVDLYGPSDFTATNQKPSRFAIAIMKGAFGVKDANDRMIKRASPVTYVTAGAPPFLILHGDHDGRVNISQSVELEEKLKLTGVSAKFVVITNYSHGFTPLWLRSRPTPVELARTVADFFDKNLR
jgi:acetyl esterase/lipase